MDEIDRTQLEQVLRLAKENNQMLRSMRRNAWLGGIFKLAMWAVFIILPLWLYLQYIAPLMGTMLGTIEQMQQLQGTGTQVQAQFGDLNESLQKLKSAFPQYFQQ